MKRKILLFILCLIFLSGCSLKRFAVNRVVPVLQDVDKSIFSETNYKLVESGLPGSLLLMQGMLRATPNNFDLLVMNAEGFCGYATGFVEDEDPEYATALYLKGRDYGLKALKHHRKFRKNLEKGEPLREAIKLIDDKDYLNALLWTGLCWGQQIMLNINDPLVIVNATDVKAIMEQVILIDDSFLYGMGHVFFGAYYASLPSIFIGGPEKVEAEFKKAFEISEEKFLLANVFYARYYATLMVDEALFDQELNKVLEAPSDAIPEAALMNEIAKAKARRLLKDKSKYF
ncbi:MAG: hypothetical protein JSU92_06455 [Deltaproteobacteria bacterium]|nr:MAG: hypothetical protein JSU92_06455 [Deltaproteobacteria bacterium]